LKLKEREPENFKEIPEDFRTKEFRFRPPRNYTPEQKDTYILT
jgi:hypothetical protein